MSSHKISRWTTFWCRVASSQLVKIWSGLCRPFDEEPEGRGFARRAYFAFVSLDCWLKLTKHKRESSRGAKVDCGASNECAARDKNTHLIIKCAADRGAKNNRCKRKLLHWPVNTTEVLQTCSGRSSGNSQLRDTRAVS